MPRPTQLASVPTEALVEELQKRFAAIEKAKALLFGSPAVSDARKSSGKDAKKSQAASDRWKAWHEYKAAHPNATTKDWFKQQKAKAK